MSKMWTSNIQKIIGGFMKGKMVSTENLAIGIWEEIEPHIIRMGVDLHCVKLQETENNYAEYYGNK